MQTIATYLKLMRWQNLLIMAGILLLLRYAFLVPLGFEVYLSPLWHATFILATLFIAAGGNVINDAFDVNADRINKPEKTIVTNQLSIESAKISGQVFLLLGVIIGLSMGYFNQMLTFSYIFPLSALLLWFYTASLKRQPFIGNVVVSFLAALLIVNEIIFDILKTYSPESAEMQKSAILVISGFAGFAFVITLCREIIKDIEDIPGDSKAGYRTLPITSGTLFPKILVIVLLMLTTVSIGWIFKETLSSKDFISAGYLLVFVMAPLLFIIVRIAPATKPFALHKISALLKFIMVTGILSIAVFTLSFKLSAPEPEEPPKDIRIEVGG